MLCRQQVAIRSGTDVCMSLESPELSYAHPNLLSLWVHVFVQDVADYLTKGGYGSESEGEDAGDSRVMLERDMGRGNLAARQSRVKLQEVRTLAEGTCTYVPG